MFSTPIIPFLHSYKGPVYLIGFSNDDKVVFLLPNFLIISMATYLLVSLDSYSLLSDMIYLERTLLFPLVGSIIPYIALAW